MDEESNKMEASTPLVTAFINAYRFRVTKGVEETIKKLADEFSLEEKDLRKDWNRVAKEYIIPLNRPKRGKTTTKSKDSYGSCEAIIRSGDRAGDVCGITIRIKGNKFCGRHQKK